MFKLLYTALLTLAFILPDTLARRDEAPMRHIVVETNEDATYSREGWREFTPLPLGTQLATHDLIDPGSETVRVLCADLSEQVIVDLSPVVCPEGERLIIQEGEETYAGWQRGNEDIMIPFLIAPRSTTILSPHPLIRWNPVPGVDGYRVFVRGEDVNWFTEIDDPQASELAYPEDAPALAFNAAYTVEVIALSFGEEIASSSDEGSPGISFTLAQEEEATSIRQAAESIEARITHGAADLALAHYYMQNGLNAEALNVLWDNMAVLLGEEGCALDEMSSDMSIPYLMLGDLLLRINVELYAQHAYACAFKLAQEGTEIVETQALAAEALADLSFDEDQRQMYVQKAIEAWEKLGAQDRIEALTGIPNASCLPIKCWPKSKNGAHEREA